jgi:hypothetical protein
MDTDVKTLNELLATGNEPSFSAASPRVARTGRKFMAATRMYAVSTWCQRRHICPLIGHRRSSPMTAITRCITGIPVYTSGLLSEKITGDGAINQRSTHLCYASVWEHPNWICDVANKASARSEQVGQ